MLKGEMVFENICFFNKRVFEDIVGDVDDFE